VSHLGVLILGPHRFAEIKILKASALHGHAKADALQLLLNAGRHRRSKGLKSKWRRPWDDRRLALTHQRGLGG